MSDIPTDTRSRSVMDCQLQVVTVPVTDVDLAAAFYTQQAGFVLDVDYHPTPGFRVVQLTPPGSACSIQIGTGLTDAPPGSARAAYLAVTDIEAARRELTRRGLSVSAIRHKSPIDGWKATGSPVPTRSAATMPASPASPTRTATRGCSRRSASAPQHPYRRRTLT
jgi:predicted enzyme related to lactoylglutathione lyase